MILPLAPRHRGSDSLDFHGLGNPKYEPGLHSSSPALRSLASSVLGDTPSFSEALVLFHLHSRRAASSMTLSMWPTARPVTSSSVPSQLNFSGSMPEGSAPWSGLVAGNCSP